MTNAYSQPMKLIVITQLGNNVAQTVMATVSDRDLYSLLPWF